MITLIAIEFPHSLECRLYLDGWAMNNSGVGMNQRLRSVQKTSVRSTTAVTPIVSRPFLDPMVLNILSVDQGNETCTEAITYHLFQISLMKHFQIMDLLFTNLIHRFPTALINYQQKCKRNSVL